jgi:hypothetical protein
MKLTRQNSGVWNKKYSRLRRTKTPITIENIIPIDDQIYKIILIHNSCGSSLNGPVSIKINNMKKKVRWKQEEEE